MTDNGKGSTCVLVGLRVDWLNTSIPETAEKPNCRKQSCKRIGNSRH